MRILPITLFIALTASIAVHAQINPRAWHTNGQTWIIWTANQPALGTNTYDIYARPSLSTNLSQWTLLGRVLPQDWQATRLSDHTAASQWLVPRTNGQYRLATNEGLFVYTPHATGAVYFAVVQHGNTGLGASNTIGPIAQPLTQPVTCHPQNAGTNVNTQRFTDYALWLDGRADWTNSRPDIPVLGNASFNGVASLFRIYQPLISQAPGAKLPTVLFAHGKGRHWTAFVPGDISTANVPLVLTNGLLVTLDDGVWVFNTNRSEVVQEFTFWLGYWEGFDRFATSESNLPPDGATVVDFTVRKNQWLLDWIIANHSADSNRVAWMGTSMGAGGGGINVRAHPERFSAATFFVPMVHASHLPLDPAMRGSSAQNLPTPLGLGVNDLHYPTNSTAPDKLPPMRFVWGVEDTSVTWNSIELGQKTNVIPSLAASRLGFITYWDERAHVPQIWEGHWAGPNPSAVDGSPFLTAQFLTRYRNDRSFPAFSNDRHPNTNVFLATPGCGTCTNWGTRGGYFDWNVGTVTDTATNWGVTLWMHNTNTTTFSNDIPAFALAVTDVSVRRPQQFKPMAGILLDWNITDLTTGAILQSGTTTVGDDGLVTVPAIVVFRDKPVRLCVSEPGGCAPPPLGDFGDAPAPYPTTLAQAGALHTSPNTLFLGAAVDTEANGQASPFALGDDNLATDDEDGVIPTNPWVVDQNATIHVIASGAGFLDAFLDTNADGDWTDPGEQIFTSRAVVAGTNQLSFLIPSNAVVGQAFARFRLSAGGGLSSTGSVANGEVEDYRRVINAPASSNLYAGLRFSAQGSAQASVSTNGLLVSNNSAQTNSGVSFDLGQAEGFQSQVNLQQVIPGDGVLTRIIGRQGGLTRPLVSFIVKWDGPDFDASKNEVAIESIELAHEGLSVTHHDASGRQLGGVHRFPGGAAAMQCIQDSPPPTGDEGRCGSIIVMDDTVGKESLQIVVAPFGIQSPRDAASGLPTGRMLMKDGANNITLENYAFSIFTYEGLTQPVEALERVALIDIARDRSGDPFQFSVTEVGLIHDGMSVSSGANTLLTASMENSSPGFYVLPEVDDEVLVQFTYAGITGMDDWEKFDVFRAPPISEIALPGFDSSTTGSTLSLETDQTFIRPGNPGVIESIGTKYTMLKTDTGYSLQSIFKGELVGIEPSYHLRIFNQGAEVASFLIDQDIDQPDMAITGPGKPIRVQPGLNGQDESFTQTGFTFDAPMAIRLGNNVILGDELAVGVGFDPGPLDGKFGPTTAAKLRLYSPGQTEYRLTPEEPWDWGDLPAPFMTTAAQNGARHRIMPGLRLGRRIDPDSNGRPNAFATGDDRFLNDDEDAVIFTSALVAGSNATVNVAVTAPPTGAFIDAFFEDENGDGDFEDPGEKILHRQPVANGINSFTFAVPATAMVGKGYARFRLSLQGGLDCEGPANSGEVEDYVVRIVAAPPPAHPSGLAVVTRGGANLRVGAGGAFEIDGITDGGDDGVNLLAPSNVVSRAAGRIILPFDPPLGLIDFQSTTRPHNDGLLLEAHYSGVNGKIWQPTLRFLSSTVISNAPNGTTVRLGFQVWCEDTELFRRVRTCVFDAGGYVGSFFWNPNYPQGGTGYISGSSNAHIVRLGWATFPSSVLAVFDQNVTFTGPDGTQLTGRVCRSLVLDESGEPYSPPDLTFTGLSIYGYNPSGGLLGFSDLRVCNPLAPRIRSLNFLPNGPVTLGFATEPDAFYILEATDSLGSPNWTPPTAAYQFGTGGGETLAAPQTGAATRFYRMRVE